MSSVHNMFDSRLRNLVASDNLSNLERQLFLTREKHLFSQFLTRYDDVNHVKENEVDFFILKEVMTLISSAQYSCMRP